MACEAINLKSVKCLALCQNNLFSRSFSQNSLSHSLLINLVVLVFIFSEKKESRKKSLRSSEKYFLPDEHTFKKNVTASLVKWAIVKVLQSTVFLTYDL